MRVAPLLVPGLCTGLARTCLRRKGNRSPNLSARLVPKIPKSTYDLSRAIRTGAWGRFVVDQRASSTSLSP